MDHVLLWSRYADNGVENLVIAHKACNESKDNYLAATEHVVRWKRRFDHGSSLASALEDISRAAHWEWHPERTLGVARYTYLTLPEGFDLWLRKRSFVKVERERLSAALLDCRDVPSRIRSGLR